MSTVVPAPPPATLEELLTPGWVRAALAPRFGDVDVVAVHPGPVVSRVSTNARFTIECAGPVPEGLPLALCAKGYFGERQREFAFVGVREVLFYREVAEPSGVRTLQAVYAGTDEAPTRGVVVTADVLAAGGRFLDARDAYSADQVAESLDQLAQLHTATWGDRRYTGAAWLQPQLASYMQSRGLPEITGNFDGPLGDGVPAAAKDAVRLLEAFRAIPSALPLDVCVIHGDAHVGNLWLDRDGHPGLVDWQCVQTGHWGIDIGYHIASALTPPERERHERDLVAHYLERVRALRGEAPAWDEAWSAYRAGIVYGFFLWAITLRVDPPIIATLLERLGTAAAAHDCLGGLLGG
jgi:hypothetical protein